MEGTDLDKFIYKKEAGLTALSAHMQNFSYKKHAHEEYAIGVTLKGVQAYHSKGSLHHSYQNNVMIFNPEQMHDGMSVGKTDLSYVMLYIPTNLLLEATGKKELIQFSQPLVSNDRFANKVLSLSTAILTGRGDIYCSELLLSLTDDLVGINHNQIKGSNHTLVKKAKEIMQSHLHTTIRLDDICNELQLSKFQFIRLFQTETGMSPYQYFLNAKTEQAKNIIDQERDIYTALNICGFVDLSHLNKQFKRMYGLTAFEYFKSTFSSLLP